MAAKGSTSKSQNQKREGPRTCKFCDITFPDAYDYLDHLEDKAHIKGVMKKKYGEKYLEAKSILQAGKQDNDEERNLNLKSKGNDSNTKILSKDTSQKNDSESSLSDSDSSVYDDVYICEICKKICTGLLNYKLHLSGNKHAKMARKMELLKQMEKKNLIPKSNNPANVSPEDEIFPGLFTSLPDMCCKICNKAFSGPEPFKQHNKSDAHKKKVAMQSMTKEMEDKGLCKITSKEEPSTKIFHCDICEKEFSGPVPYQQHIKSIAHLKVEKNKEQLSEVKDLINVSEEDSRIQCKECSKFFSGPQPFKDHLQSSIHGKVKKKSSMLEDLEKKFPDMIVYVKLNSDDSDSDDKRDIITCKVCSIGFSGPESARDHFLSQKHKKAAKEKKRYKMLKKQAMELKKDSPISKNSSESKQEESFVKGSSSDDDYIKL